MVGNFGETSTNAQESCKGIYLLESFIVKKTNKIYQELILWYETAQMHQGCCTNDPFSPKIWFSIANFWHQEAFTLKILIVLLVHWLAKSFKNRLSQKVPWTFQFVNQIFFFNKVPFYNQALYQNDKFTEEEMHNYRMAVTEREVRNGCITMPDDYVKVEKCEQGFDFL